MEKEIRVISIEESEEMGVVGCVTMWGYEVEELWRDVAMAVMSEQCNPGGMEVSFQTDVVAMEIDRGREFLEDRERKRSLVMCSGILFESKERKEEWDRREDLVITILDNRRVFRCSRFISSH